MAGCTLSTRALWMFLNDSSRVVSHLVSTFGENYTLAKSEDSHGQSTCYPSIR